jgi:hypothetical protein
VSPIPIRHQKKTQCRAQTAAITLSPAEEAIIYFHKFAMLPPPNTFKKAVKSKSK